MKVFETEVTILIMQFKKKSNLEFFNFSVDKEGIN